MNLYLIFSCSCNPLKLTVTNPLTAKLECANETILYEPSEEADAFMGHCLMIGSNIKFIPLTEPVEVSEFDKVYVYSHHYPDVATTLDGRIITSTTEQDCIHYTMYSPCPPIR